jgi:hypothetical protein
MQQAQFRGRLPNTPGSIMRPWVGFAMLLLAGASFPSSARTVAYCNAVALVDVPDWGDGVPEDTAGTVLKKGEIDEAVTQYRINKKTKVGVFCSHGGYCYPRYLTRNGQKIETLRLSNCTIGTKPSDLDDDLAYDVVADGAKKAPPKR